METAALRALCDRAYETRLNETGKYTKRVRVGQVVYVRSGPGRGPYIAAIRRVRHGVARMRWFYRPDDIPASVTIGYVPAETELFISADCDDNATGLIIGTCDVGSVETGTGYFCRAAFTGTAVVTLPDWKDA